MLMVLLAAALPAGCVAFPRGESWPKYESRLADGAQGAKPGAVTAALD
ncbi:MAG: hypothetical protein ISS74_08040, partial [Planctomycetes bacterium]|nr:hypothetical protein [Planctomycetota bacterium]